MPDDGLSDDDKALFRLMMQSVKPSPATNIHHDHHKQRELKIPKSRPLAHEPVRSTTLSVDYKHSLTLTLEAHSTMQFYRTNFPPKRRKQLQRGEIAIEARLDLHGDRLDTAQTRLCHFIEHHCQQSHRCVLIIHGKGSRHGEMPVLKNHVNDWLVQIPHVQAFHSAHARHGGHGAVYVLLYDGMLR